MQGDTKGLCVVSIGVHLQHTIQLMQERGTLALLYVPASSHALTLTRCKPDHDGGSMCSLACQHVIAGFFEVMSIFHLSIIKVFVRVTVQLQLQAGLCIYCTVEDKQNKHFFLGTPQALDANVAVDTQLDPFILFATQIQVARNSLHYHKMEMPHKRICCNEVWN